MISRSSDPVKEIQDISIRNKLDTILIGLFLILLARGFGLMNLVVIFFLNHLTCTLKDSLIIYYEARINNLVSY